MKDDIPEAIEVACHNAVNSCTLSGPADDIDEYVEKIKNRGIFARSVNVGNIAYHSRYIRPFAPKHFELLKKASNKFIFPTFDTYRHNNIPKKKH